MRSQRYEVVLLPPALRDIDDIHAFIAASNPLNADRFVLRLKQRIHSLERFPRRWRIARESRIAGFEVRAATLGPYRVLFAIIAGHVAVMRVVHSAQEERGPGFYT